MGARRTGISAMTSLNGPDIWLSPYLLKPGDWSHNAATLIHEVLHTFNMTDPEIQAALFGSTSSKVGEASVNITNELFKDCFKGYAGPQ